MKVNINKLKFSFLIGFALIEMVSCNSKLEKSSNSQPNILFIAVDDLRPELATFGAKHIHSPNIEKLASEGYIFNRTYCNIPVCGASRASILSGIRPGLHRFLWSGTELEEVYPGALSLPMHFKNNGYTTVSNGKVFHRKDDNIEAWDVLWRPNKRIPYRSRDYFLENNLVLETDSTRGYPYECADVHDTTYNDGRIAEKTIMDLNKLKNDGNSFFLAVGFYKPHLPFSAPKKYWDMYDSTVISLPDNYFQPASTPKNAFHEFHELRNYSGVPTNPEDGDVSDEMANKLIHGYYACVSYVDAQIGKVLNELKDLGLADNTIVVIWGDHGWNLGDHKLWCKHCNFKSSLQVPLLLKVPGKEGGKQINEITEYVDVYPSLCDLAGLSIPKQVDGESFIPLMDGRKMEKDYAISKYGDGVTLIKENYFYTEFIDNTGTLKAKMLFDSNNDPLEINNLAEDPVYKEEVEKLSEFLRANWGDDFFLDRRVKSKPE